jgi:hypothetical protein
MIGATLDIFRKLPNGQPMWIKAVEGFDEAKRELSELVIILFLTPELAE